MTSNTTISDLDDANTRHDLARSPGSGMSESSPALYRAAVQRAMAALDGFARGLGLDQVTMLEIVETVVVEMPLAEEEERLIEARHRMIIATV